MGQLVDVSNGPPSCIRAGEVLGGKYRLERELGRGSMGTVWAAQHLSLGQRVAIKLIAAEYAQSAEARERFSVEAKAAAQLRSRHVVQVYDDGETAEGTPYIVMEYLEGESLEARLEREQEVPLVDAVRITAQVARALTRAHAQNIVHRDLKPGNIYLARSDEDEVGWTAKVLDFGIAKVEEHREHSTTKAGTLLGTPLFMSPEQVRGASSVDGRADLYSLGICFYNMVSGKLAFDGDSFGDVLVSICTDPLPDLKQAAPWIPENVGAWFQRCCARDPALRFQSAEELMAALQSAAGPALEVANGRSLLDERLAPSGTMTHSSAVAREASALGNHEVILGNGERSAVSDATAVLTVHDAPTPPRTRRNRAFALLTVLGIAAAAGAMWRVRGGDESAPPRSAAAPAASLIALPQPKSEPPAQLPTAAAATSAAVETTSPKAAPSAAPAVGRFVPKHNASASPRRQNANGSAAGTAKAYKTHKASAAPTVDIGF